MATTTTKTPMTAEEFLRADLGEGYFELVRGEVVALPPAMPEHGIICSNTVQILGPYGRRSGLGYVLCNDSAVQTERGPDTVRGADICFFSYARWPRAQVGRGLPPVPPDLIVEVYSPGDRPGRMRAKIHEYLEAGVLMVWVIRPDRRTVSVYRPDEFEVATFRPIDTLEGFPELPGFVCAVADFFA